MVGLKDIAAIAGVSKATVSKALSGSREISVEVRNKILEIARQQHYKPKNLIIPDLACRNMIALVLPEVINHFAEITNGILSKSAVCGYTTVVGITNFEPDREKQFIRDFTNMHVAGMMILLSSYEIGDILSSLQVTSDIPVIQLGKSLCAQYDSVCYDLKTEAFLAVNHLYQFGHRQIGYIGEIYSQSRYDSLVKVMHEFGLEFAPSFVHTGKERFQKGGYLRAGELLRQGSMPTAIIAAYDDMAAGAIKAFTEAGLQVPNDISIIGYDNALASPYMLKPLTTISEPADELGAIAIQMLINRIESPVEKVIQNVHLTPRLIVRDTTTRITR